MKKIFLFLFLLPVFALNAQDIEKTAALKLVNDNITATGLSETDLKNSIVSNAYISNPAGIKLVYLLQSYMGLPVYNKIHVLAFKNDKLVSKSGGRIKSIETKAVNKAPVPSVTPEAAVFAAMAEKKITAPASLTATRITANKLNFGKTPNVSEDITAELMWLPLEEGKIVKLVWQVYLVPNTTSDYWMLRVDAVTNKVIDETNLTVYCNWTKPAGSDASHDHSVTCSTLDNGYANFDHKTTSRIITAQAGSPAESPLIVNGASYRVIPFPSESPRHTGGAHTLVTDPWNAAPGNATTLKWHSNGTTDFNITRGNNVWAQEDLNANNGTGLPATSTTGPDPLTFNFVPDFSITPTQTTPVQNQQFNITNLFYWNNIIHDVTYQYGFDEPAGNFQANNLARGGVGNDYVLADAQDGNFVAPNQNNANFSTPADGGSGRMQMYLWDSVPRLTVNTPAVIAGQYSAIEGNMSTNNRLIAVGPVTADVVLYIDNSGGLNEACVPPSNSIAGKIVIIKRGNCAFALKVKAAQDAGAVGVIMVNNVPGAPIIMGGADNTITIPAMMISDVDGAIFIAQVANNLNVTMAAGVNVDGDVDNGIMVHEYGHGISNRLTGGPAVTGCVSNAEHMGEGWSDYYSLMLTQNWATSTVNTGFNSPRGIGTYAVGQPSSGLGIRTQKYSTDFTVNNLVYTASLPGAGLQHTRGELWAATLWDMTWNIIQQTNSINPNIYNPAGGGGNTIALRLVTEGMKLQPCGPGFLDGRDAILQADQILYGGAYSCAIKEAFRRRGMGQFAIQGSANSTTDQVPDFSATLTVKVSANVTQVPEGQNIVYTNTVTSCSPVTNYLLTDTLPLNVTYVSGGSYNAANRVVSFPVNLTMGQTQTYTFTVNVNSGTYFPTITLLDEPVAAATMPATLTPTSTTATVWTVTNAQSHSAPNSVFSPNALTPSDQILTTTNNLPLGTTPTQLSFWHLYNTEQGYDGGVVEISTDGGTSWIDLGEKMNLNRYNGGIDPTAGTPIAGRQAYTGVIPGFIKTSVNLSSFVNQSAKFRWRFNSDDGTAAVGWYVDDINVKSEPLVFMRSTLSNSSGVRQAYNDTVTLITQSAVCVNVSITTQPANTNVCSGSNATFTVVAAGTSPTYQWQVSTDGGTIWTNITGATTATLTVNAVTPSMDNYRYRAIVSNTCPSTVTSTGAILTVSTPASITTQPVSVTVCEGGNPSFTVTANGTNLTYQWQVSTNGGVTFTNITGATAATLSLTGVTPAMNGNQYHVLISSCNPTPLTSANVTLTVNSNAAISVQPVNTSACTGGNAVISVTATGTALTYQWQVSTDGGATWNNITGATSASLNLTGITSGMNNNRYRVVVSNVCAPIVTSTAITLTVSDPASITAQPVPATVCAGSNTSFSVTATGTNITYQWQVSTDGGTTFTNVTGATTNTLNLTSVTTTQNGNVYRVTVFSCSPTGLNSSTALLTVNSSPAITAQPANTTACTGGNASFTATATGTSLTYQWQVSTDGGVTYTNITGATTSTLNLTGVTLVMNNNRYRVIVNGTCPGAITSNPGILTVSNAANITTQPANTAVCNGNNATFTATATGSSFQWQVSTNGGGAWTDIIGATTTTLVVTSVTPAMNNNQYRLAVSSCSGAPLNSSAATLTVNSTVGVTTQPANTAVCIGANATFTVTATGTNATYQWQVSTDGGNTFTNITGANAATLNLASVTTGMNNNSYRVVVNNTCPSTVTSSAAVLTVNNAPVVNAQPSATSVCVGNNTSFTVIASGTTLTYQWQVSIDGGVTFGNIAGETSATLNITNAVAGMNLNQYRVQISGCGTVNSQSAVLTVNPVPSVTIIAAPSIKLLFGESTTITATSNPVASNYTWYKNNVVIPGATGNSIIVTYNTSADLTAYKAQATTGAGCSSNSNVITISDSTITTAFIFPNPNQGEFFVQYNVGAQVAQPRIITIFDGKGARVYSKVFTVLPAEKMKVIVQNLAAGLYIVELSDANGNRIAKGKVNIL